MEFDTYIEKAKRSIFRFEGLQDYSAEDGDDFVNIYIETRKLQMHPSETKWWQDIHKKNQDGIHTCRVRLVTFPLTDYTKAELAFYREAADYSGEDIRVIEQENFDRAIGKKMTDFYLIDDMYVFSMEYGPRGKFLRDELITGKDVATYLKYKEDLINNSITISKFAFSL